MAAGIKVSFTLDEADIAYFRRIHRNAKKKSASTKAATVVKKVRALIDDVRSARRVPSFVSEAVNTLEQLVAMTEDEDYALPKAVERDVIAALVYFTHPTDLVPDSIPALGFLDDAIIIKVLEQDFKLELSAYRKFCTYRDNAEVRPWSSVAKDRRQRVLEKKRKELRAQITKKKLSARAGGFSIWRQ